MPEYQMSHASTKAIAASQSAEMGDFGCGSIAVDSVPRQPQQCLYRLSLKFRPAPGGRN
jgi:hypothetical protein